MVNDICPEGGQLIAKALQKNTTLKYIRISGNKIKNKNGIFLQQSYKFILREVRSG